MRSKRILGIIAFLFITCVLLSSLTISDNSDDESEIDAPMLASSVSTPTLDFNYGTVTVSVDGTIATITIAGSSQYRINWSINWGDDSTNTGTTNGDTFSIHHTYSSTGTYTISVSCAVYGSYLNNFVASEGPITTSVIISSPVMISFNANRGYGSVSSISTESDTVIRLPTSGFTRDGYRLTGWNTNSSGTGTHYSLGGSFSTKSNVTLFAEWTPITYTISFSTNGGTGSVSSRSVTSGSIIYMPSYSGSKAGYSFTGWNTNSSGTGAHYDVGVPFTVSYSRAFYAEWTPITYTVTFNSNGGTGSTSSQTVAIGDIPIKPDDPTKDGYVFGGWYTDIDLTQEYTFTTSITGDTTLYARWYEELTFISFPSLSDITVTIDGRTITASIVASNYEYILWDMGNGEIIKTYTPNITYTYETIGNYTITATAINSSGKSDTVQHEINLDQVNSVVESIFWSVLAGVIVATLSVFFLHSLIGGVLIGAIVGAIIAILIFFGVL